MPRKPTKTKLLEIFETQYNMSRDEAKKHVEDMFNKLLPKQEAKVVHMHGVCGGISAMLNCGFGYAFALALPVHAPAAIELRVMFYVCDRLGNAETLKWAYLAEDDRKKLLDNKNKACGEMLKAFGY